MLVVVGTLYYLSLLCCQSLRSCIFISSASGVIYDMRCEVRMSIVFVRYLASCSVAALEKRSLSLTWDAAFIKCWSIIWTWICFLDFPFCLTALSIFLSLPIWTVHFRIWLGAHSFFSICSHCYCWNCFAFIYVFVCVCACACVYLCGGMSQWACGSQTDLQFPKH